MFLFHSLPDPPASITKITVVGMKFPPQHDHGANQTITWIGKKTAKQQQRQKQIPRVNAGSLHRSNKSATYDLALV